MLYDVIWCANTTYLRTTLILPNQFVSIILIHEPDLHSAAINRVEIN